MAPGRRALECSGWDGAAPRRGAPARGREEAARLGGARKGRGAPEPFSGPDAPRGVSAQNWTDTASEKLELAPSRYHIWKFQVSPGWMLGAGIELPLIHGS